jgi:RNA polymerase sigma factor (sigma-70 family)
MADDFDAQDEPSFDNYQKIAADYRACLLRCQQAVDQLRACEEELKSIAASRGISQHMVDPASEFRIEQEISRLSEREAQVFGLMGAGLTTQQIGQQLNISASTIETYRERLKSKLGVETGAALARQAVLWVSRQPSQSVELRSERE